MLIGNLGAREVINHCRPFQSLSRSSKRPPETKHHIKQACVANLVLVRAGQAFCAPLLSTIKAFTTTAPQAAADTTAFCVSRVSKGSTALVLAVALVLAPVISVGAVTTSQDGSDNLTIKFKASKVPEIREAQEALVQTWGYASTQFLDPKFNGVNWPQELQNSLDQTFFADSPAEVYQITNAMLSKLGDPFTRVIAPKTVGAFENATEGQVISSGFQVGEDGRGRLRIAVVASNSPAEKAGILVGDILVSVNGLEALTYTKQELAAVLRSEADIVLSRESPTQQSQLSLHLVAAPIEVHPVQYATLPGAHDGSKVGYIRLIIFSKNAAKDVNQALQDLEAESVESVILDLRDNVGGVVFSGYEVAQLFLPEGARFCYVEDGRGASEDVKLVQSHQATTKPLGVKANCAVPQDATLLANSVLLLVMVLVNGGTASTAELISASLRDNTRAQLLGEKTFGKGRTQRVIPLKGKALLLLSNTAYFTSGHEKVDKVGLQPDISCKPDSIETSFWQSGSQEASSLKDDPCIQMAISFLSNA